MPSIYKQTAAGGLNLTKIGGYTGIKCYGYNIVNTAAAARFVKLYWGPPGNWSSAGNTPTVGTDIPLVTILIPATSTVSVPFQQPIGNNGEMFMATTVLAADTDTTVVTAGDLISSIFFG